MLVRSLVLAVVLTIAVGSGCSSSSSSSPGGGGAGKAGSTGGAAGKAGSTGGAAGKAGSADGGAADSADGGAADSADGGAADSADGGAPSASTFGESGCSTCLDEACADELATCSSDPGCAMFWLCVADCGLAPLGGPDPSCEHACSTAAGEQGREAREQLLSCWGTAAAASCEACGSETLSSDVIGQQCPASVETNQCYVCEDEQCCETYAACHASADCEAYMDCLRACPVNTPFAQCELDCVEQHPDGAVLGAPRMACVSLYCGNTDACGDVALGECDLCINEHCPGSFAACFSDVGCFTMSSCIALCDSQDSACFDACRAATPEASVAIFDTFAVCGTHLCIDACHAL